MSQEYGYLRISVRTASGALPVSRARVSVSSLGQAPDDNLLAVVYTDRSGNTEKIPIAAPPVSLSLSPSPEASPSSFVSVSTDSGGYYSVVNQYVPIFPGVTSVQTVLLVPVALGGQEAPGELVRFRESGAPMN